MKAVHHIHAGLKVEAEAVDQVSQKLVTAKEIAAVLDKTERAIRIRAQAEEWVYTEEPGKGRGGRVKKYFFHSLPTEIQLLYNKEIASAVPVTEIGAFQDASDACGPDEPDPGDAPATVAGASGTAPAIPPASNLPAVILPGLTEKQNQVAVARYDLVIQYVKAKARTKSAKKKAGRAAKQSLGQAAADFVAAYNSGITYPALYKALGAVAVKTLEKWLGLLKKNEQNPECLAPQYGQHRKGVRMVTDGEMTQMLKFALNPNRYRLSQVIRMTKAVMKKEHLPSPSSEATMRRALIDWQNQNYDRWVFCREGEKALEDNVLPYLERESDQLKVGDVLVADGHKLNFRVINPWTGKEARATLLMFYDWASRYPAGWYIMMQENVQCVHAALRRAILHLGKIPVLVMLDNGKAFRAKVFTSKIDLEECGVQGLYQRLGIQTHFAAPYNAKAKPVERFFGTFNELERMLPSYTGQSIQDKPAWMLRNERLHKNLHNPFVPTIEQANYIIAAWAWGEYAKRPHRGLNGRTPESVWEAGKGPGIDEAGLDYLMMSYQPKTIHQNGITLFGVNYYDEALYGYREKVLVRYDILDLERAHIYTADGATLICEATPRRKHHPVARLTGNPLDLEAVKQSIQQKKRLKRATEQEARQLAGEIGPWAFPEATVVVEELPMSPAQIEDIQAEAAQTKVVYLDEREPEPDLCMDEGDAYERLIRRRAQGEQLNATELQLMADFEKSDSYKFMRDYYIGLEADELRIVNGEG